MECVKSHRFWNFIFKILLIVLLVWIFFSLSNISQSLKNIVHPERNGKYIDMKKDEKLLHKEDAKKDMKKDEGKEVLPLNEKKESTSGSVTVETKKEEASSGWSFWWTNDKEEKKAVAESTPTQDPEQRYNFKCDGGNLLRVYEGKYEIRGQKSTLEAGKIALDDPQSARIHFLTKVTDGSGKAMYEKVITRLENNKEVSYKYVLTTFSNGDATFTKNGIATYSNCKITK
jgi:hypothetical protein